MGEAKVNIPDNVANEEIIDRVLYEPSFFCEGRLGPSAFALTKDGETYISVFRNRYYDLNSVKLPNPRTPGDTAAGIAQLLVEDVRAISSPIPANELSVTVEAQKTKRFPFHAGIFTKTDNVPIIGGKNHTTPLFMYVQKELVSRSSVTLFSESEPDTEGTGQQSS